jgi:hypothetical protein
MTPEDALLLVEKLKAMLNVRAELLCSLLEQDAKLKSLDKEIFELIEKSK